VYRPLARDWKHIVLMNRSAIINKRPDRMPYGHGRTPIVLLSGEPQQGLSVGRGELVRIERLVHELTKHRELSLDAAVLQILPVFEQMGDAGAKEGDFYITPGLVRKVARPDAIKQVTKVQVDLPGSMQVQQSLKAEIDETLGVYANMRGAPATIGRVSATEAQGRTSQAQIRMKLRALLAEEEWNQIIPQVLGLWLEFGFSEDRARIAGEDPLAGLSMGDLAKSLEMDLKFRGATTAINRAEQAQQLIGAYGQFREDLTVKERRALMTAALEAVGTKGVERFITPEGTATLAEMEAMQQQAAQMQAQMAMMPPPPQLPPGEGAPPPEGGVPQEGPPVE
jgi:hypothetical protein